LARCSATEALNMPYFSNKPAPTPREKLPMPGSFKDKVDEKPSLKRKLLGDGDGAPKPKKLQF